MKLRSNVLNDFDACAFLKYLILIRYKTILIITKCNITLNFLKLMCSFCMVLAFQTLYIAIINTSNLLS